MDDGSSGWFLNLGVGADTDTRHLASWSFELGLLFPLFAIPRDFSLSGVFSNSPSTCARILRDAGI